LKDFKANECVWFLICLSLLLAGKLQAEPVKEQSKASQRAEKQRLVDKKAEKFSQQKPGSGPRKASEPSLGVTGIAVVIASSGVSVVQARQLAQQYQISGGRQLPPGIRKQLARGNPLPPGIAKKVTQPDFLAALPQHPGHEWQICGADLVLVAVATAVIADVLFDVF